MNRSTLAHRRSSRPGGRSLFGIAAGSVRVVRASSTFLPGWVSRRTLAPKCVDTLAMPKGARASEQDPENAPARRVDDSDDVGSVSGTRGVERFHFCPESCPLVLSGLSPRARRVGEGVEPFNIRCRIRVRRVVVDRCTPSTASCHCTWCAGFTGFVWPSGRGTHYPEASCRPSAACPRSRAKGSQVGC